ncbi:hypothetical protein [Rubritalea tangerina]
MLLPVGLALGTVTSLFHHLRQNEEEQAQEQFQVAVTLNAPHIDSGIERALILGTRNTSTPLGRRNTQSARKFIQGATSPGGTGLSFHEVNSSLHGEETIKLSYTDIPGAEKDSFLVVVIELAGSKSKGAAVKLGITPSLIRSLLESSNFKSIRFVLTPEQASPAQHAKQLGKSVFKHDQSIACLLVIKEQESVSINDINDWSLVDSNLPVSQMLSQQSPPFLAITHPILESSPLNELTPAISTAALNATEQLRKLILQAAK